MIHFGRAVEKRVKNMASSGPEAWRGHCSHSNTVFLPLTRPLSLSTGLPMEHAVLHVNPEARGPPKQCCLLWLLPWLCLACHGFLRHQRDHVGPLHWREAEVTPVRTRIPAYGFVGWLVKNLCWMRHVPFRGRGILGKRHGFSAYSKTGVQ